jgi:hypothetical protein
MGQAFDRDGRVLGEAEGATKREVFEKLSEQHPDADRIDIRTRREGFASVKDAQVLTGERMLQYFKYEHLPPALQAISKPFGDLAVHIVHTLPPNPERTVALRKLVEAKDCAVRAAL